MTRHLKKTEFVPVGEALNIGEQVHINHVNCPAGRDTKRRLYIKKEVMDNGNIGILAYCHHCNKSGLHYDPMGRAKAYNATSAGSRKLGTSVDLSQLRTDWRDWPQEALRFIGNGGISGDVCLAKGIAYDEKTNRLVLPCTDSGVVRGYQLRALDKEDKPKYLTRTIERPLYWYSGKISTTIVVVEDVLSAIRCELLGFSSIALLSNNMCDAVFTLLIKDKYDKCLIFLDNDNSDVKRSQQKMKKQLENFMPVTIVLSSRDPKEHTDNELIALLK